MKPVAIVIAKSNRKELTRQTLKSLKENTKFPYKLFTKDGMKEGEMKTVNKLVKRIDYDWEYLVRSDDDMFYGEGWLGKMMKALKESPDVWLLGGCKYPLHGITGIRKDVFITDKQAGNHWLLSREVWGKLGPFYEDFIDGQAEDVRYCQAVRDSGGEVAAMRNPLLVVHCGIKGTLGKGRSMYVEGYLQALADAVGAKTNAEYSIF